MSKDSLLEKLKSDMGDEFRLRDDLLELGVFRFEQRRKGECFKCGRKFHVGDHYESSLDSGRILGLGVYERRVIVCGNYCM